MWDAYAPHKSKLCVNDIGIFMYKEICDTAKAWLYKADNETEFSKLIALAFIFSISVVICGGVLLIIGFSQSDKSSLISMAGTFGDFIGGTLNPILSFLTFMGLLITIILQSKELEQTRQELQRSAEAQEKTEITLKIQTKNLEKQKFENTFFSLLNQHNELLKELNQIDINRTGNKTIIQEINSIIFKKSTLDDAKKELESNNQKCGHYYRVLYQILKFIATEHPDSQIRKDKINIDKDLLSNTDETEKFYSNIVRSFLNNDIIQVLAINCYCVDQFDTYYTYKLLVERYSFFEHMPFPPDKIALMEAKQHYLNKAFGNSTYI
jgi:hypothetical protein